MRNFLALFSIAVIAPATAGASELPALSIDSRYVVIAGHGHSGSLAHQFHVAFR